MLRRAAALLALAAAPVLAQQSTQPRIYVRHAGPGEPGAILREALAHPYVVRHEQWNTRLFRDSVFNSSVVVLGSDATVASTVHGDVIVVNGNLFLRPGATIDGRAIAYGGGVYESEQATVREGTLAFRDVRFDTTRTPEGIALDYHPPPEAEGARVLSLPGPYGLRVPSYTRVDGLGLPWGPRVTLANGAVVLDPTVTYRSDIGAFDPALSVTARPDSNWSVEASGGRGTFTNDRWITPDLANSLVLLVSARDYRNYWRANRIEGRVTRAWLGSTGEIALWAGARTERAWSATAGGPWSISGQRVGNGMSRFNPPVEHGRLSSALAGLGGGTSIGSVALSGAVALERPFSAPRGERFTQATIDAGVAFPTIANQSFELRSHLVLTAGDTAPPQRFAYLGGVGTLPTFDILQFGGDELAFIETVYRIPIEALRFRVLGAPTVSLRYLLGTAGVGHLPGFEQNVAVRLALMGIFVEYAVDPARGNHAIGAGLTAPVPALGPR
jgi:hypothetical protein